MILCHLLNENEFLDIKSERMNHLRLKDADEMKNIINEKRRMKSKVLVHENRTFYNT